GKKRRDRIRNEICRNTVGVERIQERIERSRLKWFGHMNRMSQDRIPKQMFDMEMEGRRRRGRPRLRWKDTLFKDMEKRGQDPNIVMCERRFNDRQWWRGFVNSRPVSDGTT
ncbi:hypothetical protein WDU94_012371, partial [Cyamophila willieti]